MFEQDETHIRRAEALLRNDKLPAHSAEVLTDVVRGYRRVVRQMKRTLSMGDRMQEELQRCARTDGLTGISNRRHFMETATRELERICRNGKHCTLCILDADFFKKINDTFGHDAGDKALISLAETLSYHIRTTDTVARFGGEEFVILFPETSCCEAQIVAERIRKAVAATAIEHNGTTFSLTVSMGLTCSAGSVSQAHLSHPVAPPSLDQLLQYADIALYAAKKNGRNCIKSYAGSVCAHTGIVQSAAS